MALEEPMSLRTFESIAGPLNRELGYP